MGKHSQSESSKSSAAVRSLARCSGCVTPKVVKSPSSISEKISRVSNPLSMNTLARCCGEKKCLNQINLENFIIKSKNMTYQSSDV